MNIYEQIKQQRTKQNLSMSELSKLSGVDASQIWRIENDKTVIIPSSVQKIIDILRIDLQAVTKKDKK